MERRNEDEDICPTCNHTHDFTTVSKLLETCQRHESEIPNYAEGCILILYRKGAPPSFVMTEGNTDFAELIGIIERVKFELLANEKLSRPLMNMEVPSGKPC